MNELKNRRLPSVISNRRNKDSTKEQTKEVRKGE